jgi:hypothetical protein
MITEQGDIICPYCKQRQANPSDFFAEEGPLMEVLSCDGCNRHFVCEEDKRTYYHTYKISGKDETE